jgi:hypothetical protein
MAVIVTIAVITVGRIVLRGFRVDGRVSRTWRRPRPDTAPGRSWPQLVNHVTANRSTASTGYTPHGADVIAGTVALAAFLAFGSSW